MSERNHGEQEWSGDTQDDTSATGRHVSGRMKAIFFIMSALIAVGLLVVFGSAKLLQEGGDSGSAGDVGSEAESTPEPFEYDIDQGWYDGEPGDVISGPRPDDAEVLAVPTDGHGFEYTVIDPDEHKVADDLTDRARDVPLPDDIEDYVAMDRYRVEVAQMVEAETGRGIILVNEAPSEAGDAWHVWVTNGGLTDPQGYFLQDIDLVEDIASEFMDEHPDRYVLIDVSGDLTRAE